MWMKYCKDFDHYTSLILAQHPFMCIIMHFSSHYTNNMQRLHKIIVLCNASCKLFLFLSSLSAFSAHYYLQPARQAKQEPARPLHQKPARLPAARRIIRKENQKTKFSILFLLPERVGLRKLQMRTLESSLLENVLRVTVRPCCWKRSLKPS